MIESFWLFHCAYIAVPAFTITAGGGMRRVRLPLLGGLALHSELGPLLFDAPYGPNGPRNLGGFIGGAMGLFGLKFEPAWSAPERARAMGFDPERIAHVFMTHLHYDHTGGLPYLSAARCHVSAKDWELVHRARGPLFGYARADFRGLGDRLSNFEQAPAVGQNLPGLDLLGDGSVQAFATPGHSPGHTSYRIAMADGRHVLFGGDVAFTTRQILGDERLGSMARNVATSLSEGARSIEELRAHLSQNPEDVLITSHDLELGERCINEGPVQL